MLIDCEGSDDARETQQTTAGVSTATRNEEGVSRSLSREYGHAGGRRSERGGVEWWRGDLVVDEFCERKAFRKSRDGGRETEVSRLSCSRVSCSLSNEKNAGAARTAHVSLQSQIHQRVGRERTQYGSGRLVLGVVVGLEIRVRECLLDRDALLRVEGEAALEEVDRERVRVRVERLQRSSLLERQRAEVVARAVRRDGVEVVQRGRAEDVEDERELVVV